MTAICEVCRLTEDNYCDSYMWSDAGCQETTTVTAICEVMPAEKTTTVTAICEVVPADRRQLL